MPLPYVANILTVALVSWMALGATRASAQLAPQMVDLTVTGTIIPPACSAHFSNGAEVDFGTIARVDLPEHGYHLLGSRDTALNVICSSGKRVFLSVSDMQSDTALANTAMYSTLGAPSDARYVFGLGTASVNDEVVNLGSYTLESANRTVDGTARSAIYSDNGGAAWATQVAYLDNTTRLFTAGDGTTPALGKSFRFPLRITAALNTGTALQVDDDTELNGQAVFAIGYQ